MELILKTPSLSSLGKFCVFSLIIMLNAFFPKDISPFQGLKFYTQQAYNIPQNYYIHSMYVVHTYLNSLHKLKATSGSQQ